MHYHPDEPRAQARERVFGRMRSSAGDGRQSMLAVLLAVSIFVGTGALGFWQATAPARVQDQLELGIAELTDVDNYLGKTLPDLRREATASSDPTFDLPGYPLPITLTRTELLDTEDPDVRELVLERSAAIVYVSGLEAFDRTGNQDLGFLTSEWWLDRVVGLLTGGMPDRARLLAIVAFLVAAAAATTIFARRPAGEGLRSTGFAVLAGAVPGVVFMAAGAYWFGRTGGDDPFVGAIAAILEDFFIVPRRDYLVVTTVGALFAAVGYLLPIVERVLPVSGPAAMEPSMNQGPPASEESWATDEPETAADTAVSEQG